MPTDYDRLGALVEPLPSHIHVGTVWFFHIVMGRDMDAGLQILDALQADPVGFYDWLRAKQGKVPLPDPPAAEDPVWEKLTEPARQFIGFIKRPGPPPPPPTCSVCAACCVSRSCPSATFDIAFGPITH